MKKILISSLLPFFVLSFLFIAPPALGSHLGGSSEQFHEDAPPPSGRTTVSEDTSSNPPQNPPPVSDELEGNPSPGGQNLLGPGTTVGETPSSSVGGGNSGPTVGGSNTGSQNLSIKLDPPLGSVSTLKEFILKLLDIVIKIALPIAVLFIVYSGFLFVKAQGNDGEITKAKEAFFYAVIGTGILLGAQVVVNVLEATINQLK